MTVASDMEPILSAEAAIRALSGEDQQIRYYAAWWLGKHQVQSAWEVLCQALEDEDYRTAAGGYPLRRQAARALGELKNPLAVPALLRALNCEDLRLREAVIQALAAIGDARAIPALRSCLESKQEQPLEALIEGLATLSDWEMQPLIQPFLTHASERVQCAAARYFYLCTKQPEYIERIVRNLNHDNLYLRWAAAFDLGAIGHLEAAAAIVQARIGNSLKLLNLKRIWEAVLESEQLQEEEKQDKSRMLMSFVDELLIQL